MSILRRCFALSVLVVATSCPEAFGQTKAYPVLQQQSLKLSGSGATGAAQQGAAVAISLDGNTAIVGGPADNSNIGGAWIFVRNGGTWTQQGGELIGTGATGAAKQGSSVAISGDGNTVLIGGLADNTTAGATWVFTRNSEGAWTQQGSKLLGTGATGGANQGSAVAISSDGNTAIVGGPSNDSGDGGVWIFTRSGSTWTQQGGLLLGSGIAGDGDNEGGAVAISGDGNTILFGSAFDNGNAGAFWLFTRSGGTWSQLGSKMVGTGATGAAQQGASVALSADGLVAAIGGPANNSSAGAVWIFTQSAGTWTQQSLLTAAATDASGAAQLGSSMAVSGDGAVIASGGIADNSAQGGVFIFGRTGVASWAEQGPKVLASDASSAAKFGSAVSISGDGNSGIFGANADASSAGAVWPYNSNIFFGGVAVGTPVTQTITIEAQNGFTIGTTPGMIVVTQGVANLDFTLASTQPASNACHTGGAFQGQFKTCSVNIQFNPTAAGIRQGAIQFFNNESNVLSATVYFYGVGLAPLIGFGPQLIETVAGNGTAGYSGDTGPAPAAELDTPYGVSLDANDNLYIADYNNAIVRMVNPQTDVITKIAGTPDVTGSTGNGGAATSAKFDLPETPILDSAGNLFVADIYNSEVREISAQTGIISAYAGNLTSGYLGDGGLASSAEINRPYNITIGNNGDLYISDTYNNVVRRVSAITGIITTVAGTGTASYTGDGGPATSATLDHISAVAMDAVGNLYISDDDNNVIREVTAGTGTITTIVGNSETNTGGFSGDGGPATSAQIDDAEGLALDPAGNLYITDSTNNAVREVSVATGFINTIAGNGDSESPGYSGDDGPATAALLNYPAQPAMDFFGDLFFGDYSNNVVRIIGSVAPLSFGSVNVGSASAAQDVTVSNNGTAMLTFTSIAASANFNLDGADTTCTSSTQLAPGESCVLGVEFAPGSGGAITGSVTLLDNSRFTSQTIGLSGTGVPITPAITLTVLPTSANENQSVTFTAVLNPVPVSPFGSVNFCDITSQSDVARKASLTRGRPSPTPADGIFANCDGGTTLGNGNVDETGTATFSTTGLSPETHMIIAVYSGNAGLNEALSNTVPVTVSSLVNTTTTLAASANPAGTGQSVTFTATVSPAPTVSPFGTVSFCLGSLDVGTRLAPSPAAAASRAARRPVFTPDTNGPCGPATLLSTVTLTDSGSVTFATASLSAGTNILTAIYSGNAASGSSTSNSISEVINSAVATTTTLSANPNPAGVGQSVTFTALVSPAPTGSPLGSVSFCLGSLDDSTRLAASISATGARTTRGAGFTRDGNPNPCGGAALLGTVNLGGSGSATFATASLALGTDTVTAIYSGNTGSASSISNSISEVINSTVATTTTLAVSPNPASAGQAVSLTATVAPVPTGSPLGTVTFCLGESNDAVRMAGARRRPSGAARTGGGAAAAPAEQSTCGSGTSLDSADIDSTGTATFTSSSLSSGSLILIAVYSGNTTSDSSTSDPVTEVINPAFTVTAPQTPFDVSEDGSVAITVTVPPLGGSFTNVVTLSATGLPPGATATFNPPTVTPGSAGEQTVMTVVLAGGKSSASRIPSAPPAGPVGRVAGVLAGLCLLAGILSAGFRGTARRRLAALVILFAAVSGSIVLLSACSGGFAGGAVTPKGAYVITVTGTSGSLQASTTVNLVVE
jgi:hypothetical protein